MKYQGEIFLSLLILFLPMSLVSAQVSKPDMIKAFPIAQSIHLDGDLIEPDWQQAQIQNIDVTVILMM